VFITWKLTAPVCKARKIICSDKNLWLFIGLFQRGISQSGTALCPWAQMENGRSKATKLAQELGCSIQTSWEMVDCLRHRPAKMIVQKVAVFQVSIAYNSERYPCGLHSEHARCSCRRLPKLQRKLMPFFFRVDKKIAGFSKTNYMIFFLILLPCNVITIFIKTN